MNIDGYTQSGNHQGGLEGASRHSREMATWQPNPLPFDVLLEGDKDLIDDRSRDAIMNDGYASGAVSIHKDNIVGSQFRLNAQPDMDALGVDDDEWSTKFQETVEARFNSAGISIKNWFDASGVNDFTMLIRQAIGTFIIHGEVLGVFEWLPEKRRPFSTAVQMINPRRLSTPFDLATDPNVVHGVEKDSYGRPIAYHIMKAHPFDIRNVERKHEWKRVKSETEWGRPMVLHVIEQLVTDQTRGVSEMVSVLKQMRMTRRFQDVELQQAILQATYAATIESDLPMQMVAEVMGGSPDAPNFEASALSMLSSIAKHRATRELRLDGTKIPVLHPNTKLNLQQLGQPSGTGSVYEQSLLRHIAAGLGLSYEQFSRDYTKTNYSSARASMNETYKFMQSRKKIVADKVANYIYRNWLEEQIQMGVIPLPKGKNKNWIYQDPFILDALSRASWIGASRGQIDEMKETQSAILRVNFGLSTMELEAARLGLDYRELLKQRKREQEAVEKLGVKLSDGAEKQVVDKKPSSDEGNEDSNKSDERKEGEDE